MKICIVGSGYVGLVTGACFAEMGNEVICVDNNIEKIKMLNNNIIPIFEPGLEEIVKRNREEGRLCFTSDMKNAVENSYMIFIAVGTPTGENGSADLTYVMEAVKSIGYAMNGQKVIVNKSTVPIGTAEKVKNQIMTILQERNVSFNFDVVSNPEFLKEGAAIEDFMRPDRVVIGCDNAEAVEVMKELYAPFTKNGHPILIMSVKSAEITKYAANCMLATRISFMNELAKLCECTGADITQVRGGLGTDARIGMPFLYAGLGYGGSCFPKDIKALIKTYRDYGLKPGLFLAVEEINHSQRERFLAKIRKHFNNDLKGKVFTVWGLSFKPNTDDMREAPSVTIINELLSDGASIHAYDPQATKEAKRIFGEENTAIVYFNNQYEALHNSNALIIITEWNSFKHPDFEKIGYCLKDKIIFDGRNLYDPKLLKKAGYEYYGIGRGI